MYVVATLLGLRSLEYLGGYTDRLMTIECCNGYMAVLRTTRVNVLATWIC